MKKLYLVIPLIVFLLTVTFFAEGQIIPADRDRDGIPDLTDVCPTIPETVNNYEDLDGCPDVEPPVLVSVTPTDPHTIKLNWIEPLVKTNLVSYDIEKSIDGKTFTVLTNVKVGTTDYVDIGLISQTTYTYRIVSLATAGIPNSFSNEISATTPPIITPPPKVEINASYIGKAVLVKWTIPISESQNLLGYKWTLQRDTNGQGYVDVSSGSRNVIDKTLEKGQQIEYYLDRNVIPNSRYTYKILFSSVDLTQVTESDATVTISIPSESASIFKATGTLLDTTRIITPRSGNQILKIDFIPSLEFQKSYAETGGLEPQITSSVNPKNEPYIFSLSPISTPEADAECWQALEIIYKRIDADFGQDLTVFATILENQTIVRNQHLYDNTEISNSAQHIYNFWWVIPSTEQSIQDFSNLEVQLDIDSSDTLNPLDYRSLSIYQVNLYVPESNLVC